MVGVHFTKQLRFKMRIKMKGVREYNEGMLVELDLAENDNRTVIVAYNEAGYNSTEVDLLDVIEWVKNNRPESG